MQVHGQLQQLLHPVPLLGGEERDRRAGEAGELRIQVLSEGLRVRVLEQVPLVGGEHDGLVVLNRVARQGLLDGRQGLPHIEEQDHDIGAAHGLAAARLREELDRVRQLGLLPHPRRVDHGEVPVAPLEAHIDRVAGGARDLRHDHAVLPGQAVDQGALAGVAAPDHGQQHRGLRLHRPLGRGLGESLPQGLDQVRHPVAVLGADRVRALPHAEAVETLHLPGRVRALALVRDEHHRHGRATQARGDPLVEGGDAVTSIHEEEDQVRGGQRRIHLALHMGPKVIAVHDADPARVDHLDPARAVRVVEARRHGDAVAGHAGGGLDDCHS